MPEGRKITHEFFNGISDGQLAVFSTIESRPVYHSIIEIDHTMMIEETKLIGKTYGHIKPILQPKRALTSVIDSMLTLNIGTLYTLPLSLLSKLCSGNMESRSKVIELIEMFDNTKDITIILLIPESTTSHISVNRCFWLVDYSLSSYTKDITGQSSPNYESHYKIEIR